MFHKTLVFLVFFKITWCFFPPGTSLMFFPGIFCDTGISGRRGSQWYAAFPGSFFDSFVTQQSTVQVPPLLSSPPYTSQHSIWLPERSRKQSRFMLNFLIRVVDMESTCWKESPDCQTWKRVSRNSKMRGLSHETTQPIRSKEPIWIVSCYILH